MKVSENPLNIGKLTSIKRLKGGHKGQLFLLTNEAGEQLVVKFQNEDTVEPIAGTRILLKAGPDVRGEDRTRQKRQRMVSRAEHLYSTRQHGYHTA